MGNSNGKITAPVSLHADVYPVLGLVKTGTFYDVAEACRNAHGQINKWARYKPVRVDTPADITEEQRMAANQGLQAIEVPGIVTAAEGGTVSSVPSTGEWTYLAPRPGTDWCRMTDFLKAGYPNEGGYNHRAVCPANGFTDMEIFDSQFSELPTYTFNCKFGDASYEGIGNTNGIEIPLNMLTLISRQPITNGRWRLALAIFYPSGSGYTAVMASHEAAIGTISSTADIAKYVIDLSLSTRVRTALTNAYNAGNRSLKAIPCICYDLDYVDYSGGEHFDFLTGGRAFCMPGGDVINITLRGTEDAVNLSVSQCTIRYMNVSAGPYSIVPNGISSFPRPGATNSYSCQLSMVFTLSYTSNYLPRLSAVTPGLSGAFINTENNATYERMAEGAWQEIEPGDILTAGTYRVTMTDSYSGGSTRTPVMQVLQNLPVYTGESDTSVSVGLSLRLRVESGQTYSIAAGTSTFRMTQ